MLIESIPGLKTPTVKKNELDFSNTSLYFKSQQCLSINNWMDYCGLQSTDVITSHCGTCVWRISTWIFENGSAQVILLWECCAWVPKSFPSLLSPFFSLFHHSRPSPDHKTRDSVWFHERRSVLIGHLSKHSVTFFFFFFINLYGKFILPW